MQRPIRALTSSQTNHGTPQAYHQEGFDNLQAAIKRTNKLCATVMDTRGPEIVVLNRLGDAAEAKLWEGRVGRAQLSTDGG
jgi:pyruvate kinase